VRRREPAGGRPVSSLNFQAGLRAGAGFLCGPPYCKTATSCSFSKHFDLETTKDAKSPARPRCARPQPKPSRAETRRRRDRRTTTIFPTLRPCASARGMTLLACMTYVAPFPKLAQKARFEEVVIRRKEPKRQDPETAREVFSLSFSHLRVLRALRGFRPLVAAAGRAGASVVNDLGFPLARE
jgi:hypothetical protein